MLGYQNIEILMVQQQFWTNNTDTLYVQEVVTHLDRNTFTAKISLVYINCTLYHVIFNTQWLTI